MNSLKGPLLIIAAALFWLGAAAFYQNGRFGGAFQYSGNAGTLVAFGLLVWGLIETVRAR